MKRFLMGLTRAASFFVIARRLAIVRQEARGGVDRAEWREDVRMWRALRREAYRRIGYHG